jgi:hypothetical protein
MRQNRLPEAPVLNVVRDALLLSLIYYRMSRGFIPHGTVSPVEKHSLSIVNCRTLFNT